MGTRLYMSTTYIEALLDLGVGADDHVEDGEEENSAVGEELGGEDLGEWRPRHGGREGGGGREIRTRTRVI